MYRRKPRRNPLVIVLILVLTLTALTGTTVAKFVHQKTMSASVTFTAEIATDMTLLEHEAVRAADGSYSLKTDEDDIYKYTVTGNKYDLIPGLDIPKDPFITITGKTPIPAYLYVEVIYDPANENVVAQITDGWQLIKNGKLLYITPNGGLLYVYTGEGTDPLLLTDQNCPGSVEIINDDTITVGQKLLSSKTQKFAMKFRAYLLEAPKLPMTQNAYQDAKTVFNNAYPSK